MKFLFAVAKEVRFVYSNTFVLLTKILFCTSVSFDAFLDCKYFNGTVTKL